MLWKPRYQGLLASLAFGIPLLSLFFYAFLHRISEHTQLWFFVAVMFGPPTVYLAVLLLIQALRLLLPFITLSHFVFGGETFFDDWFTHITIRPVPPSKAGMAGLITSSEKTTYVYQKMYSVRGRGLRHCLIYSNGDFLCDVKNVILGQPWENLAERGLKRSTPDAMN